MLSQSSPLQDAEKIGLYFFIIYSQIFRAHKNVEHTQQIRERTATTSKSVQFVQRTHHQSFKINEKRAKSFKFF